MDGNDGDEACLSKTSRKLIYLRDETKTWDLYFQMRFLSICERIFPSVKECYNDERLPLHLLAMTHSHYLAAKASVRERHAREGVTLAL